MRSSAASSECAVDSQLVPCTCDAAGSGGPDRALDAPAATADPERGRVIRRRALLFAVTAQLADAVTFVAALAAGVPLVGEVNPLARAIYPLGGSGGVVDLKLAGVAALVALLALGERWRPRRSGGPRFVVAGAAIIGLGGLVGAIANVGAALSVT